MQDDKTNAESATATLDEVESQAEVHRGEQRISRAFLWSVSVLVLVVSVAIGAYWWFTRGEDPPAVAPAPPPAAHKELPRPNAPIPHVRFVDVTQAAGIDFTHVNADTSEQLLPEVLGGGCALLDYDGDGDLDILLVSSDYWPWAKPRGVSSPRAMVLYRNDGNWKFVDVSEKAGFSESFFGLGVTVGDYDNDGDPDVFVTTLGTNRLYRNDRGVFHDVTAVANVGGDPEEFSTACGWFDYDNDGDLDLFVGNYVKWSRSVNLRRRFRQEGSNAFAYVGPTEFEGTQPYLYRNEGDGLFSDASADIEVLNPDTGRALAKTLGVCFTDLNGDHWLDIVVANDTVRNIAYVNQRDGTFREVAEQIGVDVGPNGKARAGMGIDIADFRNNGTQAIAIGNYAKEMTGLFVSSPRQPPSGTALDSFTDEATVAGIGAATRAPLTFGVVFFDYDLDGRLDLLAANGHVIATISQVDRSQTRDQSPQLFWNWGPAGSREFVAVLPQESGEDLFRPMVGRAAAVGDLDGDGDLDVLLTANGGPARLLRNDNALKHHFLRFRLIGRKCKDAVGALVEVRTGKQVRRRRLMPTRSYLAQCEAVVTFGLGKQSQVDEVRIVWPGGEVQRVKDYVVDGLTVVAQP